MATESNGDAHAAELQAVKLRAVKKIKALEERVKAANAETAAANAEALAARLALSVEIGALEADCVATETLRSALVTQQQQDLSLSGALQALQLQHADQEDAHAQEVGALSSEVSVLQEERQAASEAQAAMAVEISSLAARAEQAEANAAAAAQVEAERWQRLDAAAASFTIQLIHAREHQISIQFSYMFWGQVLT